MSSNLPPGCSHRDIEIAAGANAHCEVCWKHVDACVCPECPDCQEVGNPKCYRGFKRLRLSAAQVLARQEARIGALQERLTDEGLMLDWMAAHPDRLDDDTKHKGPLSVWLDNNPEPSDMA